MDTLHGHILAYLSDMSTRFTRDLRPPLLSPRRVKFAYAIAVTVDLIQLLMGPAGWFFADEVLDIVAMVLIWRLIGFHLLLLPTFVLEFLPVADMLPTWTGCLAIVLAIRRGQQAAAPPPHDGGRSIDI
jgi:hypothetical protein